MIEITVLTLFTLAVVFVAMGPKSSDTPPAKADRKTTLKELDGPDRPK